MQKGFGPSELYHPDANPGGRVLQAGDTGVVFLPQAGAAGQAKRQVWFDIGRAKAYHFELEDEDLALLARVDVGDAAGRPLLSVDAEHRSASANLLPGRYVLSSSPARPIRNRRRCSSASATTMPPSPAKLGSRRRAPIAIRLNKCSPSSHVQDATCRARA